MHHIHHSEAFVLGSRPKGEDSKILILYTRELGMIYAHAQGLRKVSSKLRYALQDFSRANVDLVRGREVWRVTTASPVHSYKSVAQTKEAQRILARTSSLLIRLVPGEEASEEIFRSLVRVYSLLETAKSPEEYRTIELLTVARILTALGYLSRALHTTEEDGEEFPKAFDDIAYQHRLIRDINQALLATNL